MQTLVSFALSQRSTDEVKSIVAHSVRKKFWLYAHSDTGKMKVWPVPRKVD